MGHSFDRGIWLTMGLILIACPLPGYVIALMTMHRPYDKEYNITFHAANLIRGLHLKENTPLCLITNDKELALVLSLLHVHEQIEYFGHITADYRVITSNRYPDIQFIAVSECDSGDAIKSMDNFKLNYIEVWNGWVFATTDHKF
jgi:hypothetical protein